MTLTHTSTTTRHAGSNQGTGIMYCAPCTTVPPSVVLPLHRRVKTVTFLETCGSWVQVQIQVRGSAENTKIVIVW